LKDSVYQSRRDSMFSKRSIDSLRKKQGPVTIKKLLWSGFRRSNFNPVKRVDFTWEPMLKLVEYNTVEGLVANASFNIRRSIPKQKLSVVLSPHFRYGFSNQHFNAWTSLQITKRTFTWNEDGGSSDRITWTFSGGKRVSQFNKANPILVLANSIHTLFYRDNYMKLYENHFGELSVGKKFNNDLRLTIKGLFEDRLSIENTTNFSITGSKNELFTPNYPFEKINAQFKRHQAAILSASVVYRPGQQFIEFPNNKIPIGSKYPTLSLEYNKGLSGIAGSDVDFDKWKFTVSDDVNLKLRGLFKYRLSFGGFLNSKKVFIQDYQHFNGNQTGFASEYLNSFQLAPYYANSTTAALYGVAHAEHHFNGLLTNKIPLFRRLKWTLVGGSNAFYVNKTNNYVEVFAGLENIFKLMRVDVVASYLNGKNGTVALRFGFGGLLGSSIQLR
jgi:hypothetical protein